MSKPVLDISFRTPDGRMIGVKALVDCGSFYTIVREDILPAGAASFRYEEPKSLGTAGKTGAIHAVARTILEVTLCGKTIRIPAFISPDLRREMPIGAEATQAWGISVRNANGRAAVTVGRDMNGPGITEAD